MSKGVDLIIMDSDFKNFNIQCGRLFLNHFESYHSMDNYDFENVISNEYFGNSEG